MWQLQRIDQSWQKKTPSVRKERIFRVTVRWLKAGTVLKEPQVWKWLLHLRVWTNVTLTQVAGWMAGILQWLKDKSRDRSASTGLKATANLKPPLTRETAALSLFTTWRNHRYVPSDTVAATKIPSNSQGWLQFIWDEWTSIGRYIVIR